MSAIDHLEFLDALSSGVPTGRMGCKVRSAGSLATEADLAFDVPNLGGEDPRTTTAETIGLASSGKLVRLQNAGATAVALDSTVPAYFLSWVMCSGGGTGTMTPSSGTINGAASAAVGAGGLLFFNGTNWWYLQGSSLPDPVTVAHGGTGDVTLTAHAVLLGEGTAPIAFAAPVHAGYVLTDNGPGVDPSFQVAAGGSTFTSPLTTKGDIYSRSATADARLAVGLDGYMLVADSTQPLGLKWIAVTSAGAFTPGGDLAGSATSQEVIGILLTPIDASGSWTDGETLQYSALTGKIERIFDRATTLVSGVSGKPQASQLVLMFTAFSTVTFPANFATPNSYGTVGANPSATATYNVYKNGVQVGTISISTGGAFTFATTGGAAFSVNAGDRLTITAPSSQDATLSDVAISIVGTRGSVSSAISSSPIFNWRGAYVVPGSNAITFQPYDVVSYLGSAYICILASTGNLPTNTTYWNLLAQAGAAGSGGTVTNTTGALTANELVIGNGGSDEEILGSLGTTTTVLHGNAAGPPSFGSVVENDLSLSDVTTANVSTSEHGFAPKAPNDATKYLDGTGAYSVPAGGSGGGSSVPALSGFTWVNQGAGSAVQTVSNGPIFMLIPTNAALNWRGLFVALPSTPCKVIYNVRSEFGAAPANSYAAGLYFYDGTKLMGIESLGQAAGWVMRVERLTNVNTDGGSAVAAYGGQSLNNTLCGAHAPIWLQLRNDGSKIYFDISYDGTNFLNIFNENVGTTLTPTQWGFGGVCITGGGAVLGIGCLGWKVLGNATL